MSVKLLANPVSTFTEPGNSLRRRVAGDPAKPRLNVILILEESLGSEFWGSLGRKEPTLTPEMDKLAAEEGLLFPNIYASGNRTVRGMEGVLCSFPPLPGDAVVKRDLSENVEAIARVLKRDGYSTLFLYVGRGLFDGMRSFALRNGYDRLIEQKHFDHPTFTTIWGVCDEDLFNRTLQECVELSNQQQPFLATVLTVSNHKPYTYPEGRIAEDPARRRRSHAVKYSDYALGQFFKAAKRESLWTNNPAGRLTIRIEGPAAGSLFQRFTYESDEAPGGGALDEISSALRVQAYRSADIDTVLRIRDLVERGELS